MGFSWMSNPQYLAQVGHFLGGTMLVFGVGVLFGTTAMYWALGIGIAVAAIKEFVFDTSLLGFGEGDSWTDSEMDFAFYMLGGASGWCLHFWALARHVLVV
jgi:hypothetical protein